MCRQCELQCHTNSFIYLKTGTIIRDCEIQSLYCYLFISIVLNSNKNLPPF